MSKRRAYVIEDWFHVVEETLSDEVVTRAEKLDKIYLPKRKRELPSRPAVDFASVNPCVYDHYNSAIWDTLNEQDGTVWIHLNDAGESGVWINEDYDTLGPVVVLVEDSEDSVICHVYNKGVEVGEVKLPIENSFAGPYDIACKAWAHLEEG